MELNIASDETSDVGVVGCPGTVEASTKGNEGS